MGDSKGKGHFSKVPSPDTPRGFYILARFWPLYGSFSLQVKLSCRCDRALQLLAIRIPAAFTRGHVHWQFPCTSHAPWIGYTPVVVAPRQACIIFHDDAVHSSNFEVTLPSQKRGWWGYHVILDLSWLVTAPACDRRTNERTELIAIAIERCSISSKTGKIEILNVTAIVMWVF